jgi:hypothetical protein
MGRSHVGTHLPGRSGRTTGVPLQKGERTPEMRRSYPICERSQEALMLYKSTAMYYTPAKILRDRSLSMKLNGEEADHDGTHLAWCDACRESR